VLDSTLVEKSRPSRQIGTGKDQGRNRERNSLLPVALSGLGEQNRVLSRMERLLHELAVDRGIVRNQNLEAIRDIYARAPDRVDRPRKTQGPAV
jgi:hypothetical protein